MTESKEYLKGLDRSDYASKHAQRS